VHDPDPWARGSEREKAANKRDAESVEKGMEETEAATGSQVGMETMRAKDTDGVTPP